MQRDTSFQEYGTFIASTIKEELPDFETKRLFRRLTNQASGGQEVCGEGSLASNGQVW